MVQNYVGSSVFGSLAAGSYTFYVKDANGCIASTNVTLINIGSNLTLTGTTVNSSCNATNGSVTLIAANGTPVYTYSKDGATYQASNVFSGLAAGSYTFYVKDANGCVVSLPITIINGSSPITLTGTAVNPACNSLNGSVTLVATNGTPTYTYSKDGATYQGSNTFTGLAAGTYTFYAKDANGCIASTSITLINAGGNITLTGTAVNPSCSSLNGIVTLSAGNGTAPYTYSKDGATYQASNIFSSLAAGSYTFYVKDANGCIATTNIVLINSGGITASNTVTNASCGLLNGSATIVANNGTAPYTYSKDGATYQASNVFTGLAAGSYTFYAKDANGCIASTTSVIINISSINLVATAVNASCNATNGVVTLTASNGTPVYTYSKDGATYQASNVFTGLAAGSYTFYVKDASGCVASTTIIIISTPSNMILTGVVKNAACNSNSGVVTLAVANGTPVYTYSKDGATYQASNVFTGLAAGSYTFYVKDANGCLASATVTIIDGGNINLTGTVVNATCNSLTGVATLTASNGTAPYTYSKDGSTYQASNVFTGLGAGSYTFYVKDANGCIASTFINVINVSTINLVGTVTSPPCNSATGVATLTASNGTAPYTYSKDGSTYQASNVFSGLGAGSYTFYVKDANGCLGATNINLISTGGINLTGTVTTPQTCLTGGCITLSANGGTAPYTYSKDGATFVTTSQFCGLSGGTYTFSVKDANGCSSTVTVVMPINTQIPTLTILPQNGCNGTNGCVTLTGANGTAPYTYSRDGVNYQASNIFCGLSAGVYTFYVKDANGCIGGGSVVINNISTLSLTGTVIKATCGLANGSATIIVTGGAAPYAYSKDCINYSANNNIYSNLSAGTYTFCVKDANGCVASTTITIESTSLITVTSTVNNPGCGTTATTGSVTVNASNGTAPYTYSMNGGAYQANNVFTNLPAGTYTFTVKDANGCIGTTTATITVGAGNPPYNYCENETISINASAPAGYLYYQWYNNGVAIANATSQTYTITNVGSYTFTADGSTTCGGKLCCPIVVNKYPAVTLTGVASGGTCNSATNGTVTLTANGTAPYTYSMNGGTYQTNNVFTNLTTGNYTFTVKDVNGCTATTTVFVPASGSSISVVTAASDPTCGKSNGSISVGASGGVAPYTYSMNNGAYQVANVFSSLTAGTYTFNVKDANGCTGTATVILKDKGTNLTVTGTPVSAICGSKNGSVTLVANYGTPTYSYSQDGSNYQLSSIFSGLSGGTYVFYVRDVNGCIATTTVIVPNEGSKMVVTGTSTPSICGQPNGTVTLVASNGTAPYTFSQDGISYVASNLFTGLAAGTHTYYVKDANGCVVTTTVNILIKDSNLYLNASVVNPVCGNSMGSVTLLATGGTAPYTYSQDGYNFTNVNYYTNLPAGTRSFYVKDANGCIISTTTTLINVGGLQAVTGTAVNPVCGSNNGSVTLTANGGVAPYQYSKDGVSYSAQNTFGGLGAGTYTFYAKDVNNCTLSTTATLYNQTSTLAVTPSIVNPTCGSATGTVNLIAIGGTAPYTYSKDGVGYGAINSFTGLSANIPYTFSVKDAAGCVVSITTTLQSVISLVTLTTTAVNPVCGNANGSISLTGSNGAAPYVFSKDGVAYTSINTFTNLSVGSYTFYIKDANGCIGSKTVILLNADTNLSAYGVGSDATCGANNGSVTIIGNNGTAPYVYSKDGVAYSSVNTFTNLSVGTYTLYVKDAVGCIAATTVAIKSINPTIYLTGTPTQPSCGSSTGSVYLTTVGGTSPYVYSRDGVSYSGVNNYTALPAGTYTFYVKDSNGCTSSTTVTLINKDSDLALNATLVNPICSGNTGTVTISATGGTSPYTYSQNGISYSNVNTFGNLSAGTYTFYVKDANGCTATKTVVLTGTPSPLTLTAITTNPSCNLSNGSVILTASSGAGSYVYSKDGISYQASNIFTNLSVGVYTFYVKDANGCIATTSIAPINVPSTLVVTATSTQPSCNLSNGSVILSVSNGTGSYTYSKDGIAYQASNSFTNLAPGSYVFYVKDSNGCSATTTVTLQPSVTFTPTVSSNTPVCEGGSINLTSTGGGTYVWSGPNGFTSTQQSPVINNANLAMSGTYTVTVTSANGCIGTASTQVTVKTIAKITPSVSEACEGQNATLIAPEYGTDASYVWTGPNGYTGFR